MGQTLH